MREMPKLSLEIFWDTAAPVSSTGYYRRHGAMEQVPLEQDLAWRPLYCLSFVQMTAIPEGK